MQKNYYIFLVINQYDEDREYAVDKLTIRLGSWPNPIILYTQILIRAPDHTHLKEIMKSETSKPALAIFLQQGFGFFLGVG